MGQSSGKRPVAVFDIVRGGIPGPFLCRCCNGSVCHLSPRWLGYGKQAHISFCIAAQAVQRQARREAACVGPPEFLSRVTVCVDLDAPVPDPMPESVPQGLLGVPVGSKLLLSRKIKKGDSLVREVTYGIFRTPDEFVKEAMKVRHPFDAPSALDDSNIQALASILSSGVEATKSFRRQRIEHYRLRAAALQQAEEELKSTMGPEVLSIVSCKHITLLEEMLRDAGIQDQSLVEDLKQGFRLTGELKPSGLFPRQFRPASLSTDDLKATAKWSKHLAANSCRQAAGDVDVARKVCRAGPEEVVEGAADLGTG